MEDFLQQATLRSLLSLPRCESWLLSAYGYARYNCPTLSRHDPKDAVKIVETFIITKRMRDMKERNRRTRVAETPEQTEKRGKQERERLRKKGAQETPEEAEKRNSR